MTARQLWCAAKAPLRRARKWWKAHRARPWYLAEDPDDPAALVPDDLELDPALVMRERMFPDLVAFARLRMGDKAPSPDALHDALKWVPRSIPSGYFGTVALAACPCSQVLRFVPAENLFDLERQGWSTLEQFYADSWRLRRWRQEARQSPSSIPQENTP